MPIYSVKNTDTDEIFEVNMKFSEFENFLQENSNYIQAFIKFPASGDAVRMGKRKPDDNFRDVLRDVSHHHRRNSINTF